MQSSSQVYQEVALSVHMLVQEEGAVGWEGAGGGRMRANSLSHFSALTATEEVQEISLALDLYLGHPSVRTFV